MTRLECCIQLYSLIVGYKYELLKLMGLTPAFWKHVLCELKPFRKLADFILSTSLSHVYCPPHTHTHTRKLGEMEILTHVFLSLCVIAGMSDDEILRAEMVSQLCMNDRTHSSLLDLVSFHHEMMYSQEAQQVLCFDCVFASVSTSCQVVLGFESWDSNSFPPPSHF